MAGSMHITDPGVLRALSHPLRQRILGELDVREHARAADLAEALDEPANSISFHLRVLAKAGIIEEAPDLARDRRDRVWKQTADSFTIDADVPGVDQFVRPYIDWLQTVLIQASRSHGAEGAASVRTAVLTDEELQELVAEVNGVIERHVDTGLAEARRDRNNPDRRRHQVLFAVGPWEPPESATPEPGR